MIRILLLFSALFVSTSAALAQAVKDEPRPGAEPPAANFFGLVPGVSSVQELVGKLGEPAHEAKWYAWKMLYKSAAAEGAFDSIHVEGNREKGYIANIEAATVPSHLASMQTIRAALGAPEFHLTYPGGQTLLDYSERGVRFTLDPAGKTIGAAYFPHGWTRVHSGDRKRLDLSSLSQGARDPIAGVDPKLEVGTAEIDISPVASVYSRKFTVHDPMKARCVVLARGDFKVAIVGADLFGMMKPEIDAIEARLRKQGISHLLLAMSHNHAAPDTIGIYGFFPKKYVAHIQDKIVSACTKANATLSPVAKLRLASDDLSLRGARVEGFFRNARNPGLVDPQIAAIQARGPDGRALVTIVHFACHVEGLQKGAEEISADFPGYMCERLRLITGAPVVFLNGAVGGMVSGDNKARTHAEAKATGESLADEFVRLLALATESRDDAFSFHRHRIEVPVTNPRMIALEKLTSDRRQYNRGRVVSEMFHLRLGEAQLLTIPGELLPEVSWELIAKMKGYPRMIVGLANDELGYMIPAGDFRNGFYEESMSVGPAIAPVILETGFRALEAATFK